MNILKHCSEGLTLFLGFLALLAFTPPASAAAEESATIALHVEMSEASAHVTETQIVVVPGRTYAVDPAGP